MISAALFGKLKDYENKDGFYGQLGPNGFIDLGDPNKTFFAHIGFDIISPDPSDERRYQVRKALKQIELLPGIYVRSLIDGIAWHADPNEFSRDQQTSLVVLLGRFKLFTMLKRLFLCHLKRFGKYQNKDWSLLFLDENWALYWRAFNAWYLYPLILIGDFHLLLSTIFRVFQTRNDPDDVGDCLNLQIKLLSDKILGLWSPIIAIARFIYFEFRKGPQQYSKKLTDQKMAGWQWVWVWYFRPSTGAPPIDEIMLPAIKKLLYPKIA